MEVIRVTPYRSSPEVNKDDDMVRVVVDMTKHEYRVFKKRIKWEEFDCLAEKVVDRMADQLGDNIEEWASKLADSLSKEKD